MPLFGDDIKAGRDVYQAKGRSIQTIGPRTNDPSADVMRAYALLTPAERKTLAGEANVIGGDTRTLVIDLGFGEVVEASLVLATAVITLIDGVLRRRRN